MGQISKGNMIRKSVWIGTLFYLNVIMAPKAITSDIYKNRKEIPKEIFRKVTVKGGPIKIKETLKESGHDEAETMSVSSCLQIGNLSINQKCYGVYLYSIIKFSTEVVFNIFTTEIY